MDEGHSIYVDRNVGAPERILGSAHDTSRFLRNYDPDRREITFRGKTLLLIRAAR
jgi:hypothetical protein